MEQRKRRGLATAAAVVVSASLALTGCGGDSGTGPNGDSGPSTTPVSASITGSGGVAVPEFGSPSFTRRISGSAGKTMEIDRIRVVIANPRVKPSGVTSCDGGACVDVPAPVTLVELPLAEGLVRLGSVALEDGTWDGFEVEVRAPVSGEDDEFLQDHPDFEGVSVRVEGTFEGQPFQFATDVDASILLTLDPALMLDPNQSSANATVVVNFGGWFKDADGVLFDPATAESGGENESLTESRITNSIQAFQDNDQDGKPGGGGDGL